MRELTVGRYKAGYDGEDSMRSKAEKMFSEEMKGSGIKKPVPQSASSTGRTNMRLYKKGGTVKKHPMEKTQTDLVLPKRSKTPKLNVERFEEVEHMKKGGKAKMKKEEDCYKKGGEVRSKGKKYGSGGDVYENDMRGEHPSTHPHTTNYESNMKGEKGIKRLKKGGAVKKMAIGGVGKIRHNEATASGKPLSRRVVKGR